MSKASDKGVRLIEAGPKGSRAHVIFPLCQRMKRPRMVVARAATERSDPAGQAAACRTAQKSRSLRQHQTHCRTTRQRSTRGRTPRFIRRRKG